MRPTLYGSGGGTSRRGLNISSVITERLLRLLATVTIQAGPATQQSHESFGQRLRQIDEAEQRQIELLKQIERDLQRRSSTGPT